MKGGPAPQLNYSLEAFFGAKNRVIADILRCNKYLISFIINKMVRPDPSIKLVSLEVGRYPAPGCSLSLHL